MKREATANRKGEMTDGRKSGKNRERERDAAARERDDERVSTRPREGEKPSTLHICSIIHHIPRSVARRHTHTPREPHRAEEIFLTYASKNAKDRRPHSQQKHTLAKHRYISGRPIHWIFRNLVI